MAALSSSNSSSEATKHQSMATTTNGSVKRLFGRSTDDELFDHHRQSVEEDDEVRSSSSAELAEVAALIDQLKDESAVRRVGACRELCKIAAALGPRRVREELVPFLSESTEEGDDVLMAMVEELGKLTRYVGGGAYAHVLLEPVEALATVEEGAVREKAVDAALEVADAMNGDGLAHHLVPMIRRLATHDWFTGRMSACNLFALAVGSTNVPSLARRELGVLFSRLCRDDTPMVRRVAASQLAAVVAADLDLDCDDEAASDEARERYLFLFRSLAEDDQDSVRLQTVANCVGLASRRDAFAAENDILPVVLATAADRSWRVRWSAASKFADIARALANGGEPQARRRLQGALGGAFVELLNDVEAEVRVAAAVAVAHVAEALAIDEPSGDDLLVPSVEALANDTSPQVRAALASGVGALASCLARSNMRDRIAPVLLNLLADANSEVRLNVISNLAKVHDVVGPEVSTSLVPAVVDLAHDAKWRVRAAVIGHVPVVAARLGDLDDVLSRGCVDWLADDVAAVRELATSNLRALAKLFGPKWAKRIALPRLVAMCSDPYYLRRVTAVKAAAALADLLPPDTAAHHLLPAILDAAIDPVPNVRFNAAKALHTLASALRSPPQQLDAPRSLDSDDLSLSSANAHDDDAMDTTDDPAEKTLAPIVDLRIIPCLDTLKDDPDADVRDIAAEARDAVANFE